MKYTNLSRLGVAAVTCAAILAIVTSQLAFAQDRGAQSSSGFAALVGRSTIRPSDKRFQPAAAAMMSEVTNSRLSPAKGTTVIKETIVRHFFDHWVIEVPKGVARGIDMRPLSAAESLLLEELFSSDLSRVRNASITETGLEGAISEQDLGSAGKQVFEKAKVRGQKLSQWYEKGSKDLSTGQ